MNYNRNLQRQINFAIKNGMKNAKEEIKKQSQQIKKVQHTNIKNAIKDFFKEEENRTIKFFKKEDDSEFFTITLDLEIEPIFEKNKIKLGFVNTYENLLWSLMNHGNGFELNKDVSKYIYKEKITDEEIKKEYFDGNEYLYIYCNPKNKDHFLSKEIYYKIKEMDVKQWQKQVS